MAGRSRGGSWLNSPWYTDWVVWLGALVGAGGIAAAVAGQGGLAAPDLVLAALLDVLGGLGLAVACVIAIAVARAVFRVLLRVKPGRERVLTLTVRLKELGASVKYTRHPDGVVTAAVRGVPLRRRMEALAAAHAHAEKHGFLESSVVDEDAQHPGQQ